MTREPGDGLSFQEETGGNRGKPMEITAGEKKPDEERPDEKNPGEIGSDEKNLDEKDQDEKSSDEINPGEISPDVTGMPVKETPVVQEEEEEMNTRARAPTGSVTKCGAYGHGEHDTPDACGSLPQHPAAQERGETNGPGDTGVQEIPKGGETLMDPLVRAEVVIGEATKQLLIESNLTLSQPALKIRNITAEIRDLTTELIPDKVIIQGLLHKQIFFVGEDNIVHHQTEEAPFSTFVDVFGAEPGMNIQIHPTVETILFTLLNPTLLHQKVVTEFFVKVTEPTQINIREGNGPLVRLDQVIGEATKQELLENMVTLESPAIKIDDITAEIADLSVEVLEDKIVLQGVLHKQIFFIGKDNVEFHQAENVEFSTFVDVPGAEPGMDVITEPTIEFIHFELIDEDTVLQKIVVEFFVKVTESVQMNVALGPGALLKLDTVVGEQTAQLLIESTLGLTQPAVKIREIMAKVEQLMAEVIEDKIIIQGIVHKQIFFINQNNLEIHQSEDVPFSTFVDIPGAVPGMDVRIKPQIETILFELLDPDKLRQKVVLELFVKITESQQLQVQVVVPYPPYYF
ncbi:MAG TPA: DUF3794 domain-containing protein [Firmicutes bacterium]|nr:DUF3794 domain-containing protein [Bacillota bacterium]